jgi:hypothetical protein
MPEKWRATSVIFKYLPKANNHELGEDWPNVVTLVWQHLSPIEKPFKWSWSFRRRLWRHLVDGGGLTSASSPSRPGVDGALRPGPGWPVGPWSRCYKSVSAKKSSVTIFKVQNFGQNFNIFIQKIQ